MLLISSPLSKPVKETICCRYEINDKRSTSSASGFRPRFSSKNLSRSQASVNILASTNLEILMSSWKNKGEVTPLPCLENQVSSCRNKLSGAEKYSCLILLVIKKSCCIPHCLEFLEKFKSLM